MPHPARQLRTMRRTGKADTAPKRARAGRTQGKSPFCNRQIFSQFFFILPEKHIDKMFYFL
jgi:hypothetical protein